LRLHELAKEIGVTSKGLLALAREIGLNVKSHSSNLAAGEESILRFAMKQEMEEKEAEAAAKEDAVQKKKDAETAKKESKPGEEIEEESPPVTVEEATEEPATPLDEPLSEITEDGSKEDLLTEEPAISGELYPGDCQKTDPGIKPDVPSTDAQPLDTLKTKGARDVTVHKEGAEDLNDKLNKQSKRYIKPKQQATVFDADDDQLQGIQIRHWNKKNRMRRPAFRHGARMKKRGRKIEPIVHKKLDIVPPISVKELSHLTGIKVQEMLMNFIQQGSMMHINSMLNEEEILQIAITFNREIEIVEAKDVEQTFLEEIEEEVVSVQMDGEGTELRAPIVAFLGHVDHGKTSLLDAIRSANVAASEDGGITQHVSAYKVKNESGDSVVFLDTPGHKAFTEMRARGANVTDIVVLVVAADDGVMPQTEEAIQHAQAAEAPIVVAINKIDKANANTSRVKQQLAGQGVMTEDWGGEVGCVEVSATTGVGLPELLERLVLEAEIQELKCNPSNACRGAVFEARKDEEVGNVVTLLVQDGTVHVRDTLIAGDCVCRVRAMFDDQGRPITEAGPATPVNVIGFDISPESGTLFNQVESSIKAREIAQVRQEKQRIAAGSPENRYAITLENLYESIEAGKVAEIRVVLKADVKGTLEVLKRYLEDLKHDEVKVKLIRDGIGSITEDDVLLAMASDAVIIGFHSLPEDKAKKAADEHGVEIRTYKVIYQLFDDLRLAMEGALSPIQKEKVTAHLEIREVFKSSRLGAIAGCYVLDGVINRKHQIRILRKKDVLYKGDLASLKRFAEDHREVKEGFECGVKVQGFDEIKVGDIIESFEIIEEKRTLELDT